MSLPGVRTSVAMPWEHDAGIKEQQMSSKVFGLNAKQYLIVCSGIDRGMIN